MNLTLGYKEAIVNGPATFPISVSGNVMTIQGYGAFHKDQILSAFGQRSVDETLSKVTYAMPTALAIGLVSGNVNKPVVVLIRVTTSRYSSEYAVDFIKRGRPLVLEVNLSATDTAANVATKVKAALAVYESKFGVGLPFTYGGTAANLVLEGKEGHIAINQVLKLHLSNVAPLEVVGTINEVNEEARVDGKYLEENVRMSNENTDGAYVEDAGERPVIGHKYSTIGFSAKTSEGVGLDQAFAPHAQMGEGVGNVQSDGKFDFTLYFDESSTIATGGQLAKIVAFLGGALSYTTTLPGFLLADASVAAGANLAESVADFIAIV